MREPLARQRQWSGVTILLAVFVLLAALAGAVRYQDHLPRPLQRLLPVRSDHARAFALSPLLFASSKPTYVAHDRWKAYLAPESICAGGEDASAPIEQQQQAMLCLINVARAQAGFR